ncbi:GerAB/ArcD/ProY family transporter [Paenibacillus sp. OSY-SE]|uniref:GerAB/ArcD/ProY family transporter n=1 Tax=Paenibacillus sp. OSY-SE TaxID=1196323 RepID=UPI000308B60B|nr:GerAB/ArcD/ProY family transporter [Paenibacillus sp. OSY-SE]
MFARKDNITIQQMVYIVIQAQIGVGILSLPYNVAKYADHDSWISTLIAGVLMIGVILIMWMLCNQYPCLVMYDIFKKTSGEFLGKTLIVCYAVYFMLQGSYILARYGHIVGSWVLERTPHWIIISLMVAVSAYIVKDTLQSLARFYVLVTPLLIILLFLSTYSLKDANFLYILPIGSAGALNIFKGSKEAIFSMLGFDFIFFIFPFVNGSSKQKLKAVIMAHIFVTLFYTYLVFISLVYFMSPADINLTPEPFIYMIKAYSFHVIERMDLFFISIWIISVATSFMYLLLLSSKGLANLFRLEHTRFLPLICVITLIVSIWFMHIDKLNVINKYLTACHYVFQLFIPALLLAVSFITKRRASVRHEAK